MKPDRRAAAVAAAVAAATGDHPVDLEVDRVNQKRAASDDAARCL